MLDKLIRKITIIFIVTFMFGSTVFYFVLDVYHEKEAYKLIRQNVLLSESMQKYVSEFQKPAVYELINDYNLSKEYFNPALLSSTFIIGHVDKIFQENIANQEHIINKIEFKFASDNPTNPLNKATAYESKILKLFNETDIKSYSERIKLNGEDYLFFALPTRKNTKACLRCHGDYKDAPKDMLEMYGTENGFNEKEGHIRSINAIYSAVDSDDNMMIFFSLVEALMLFVFLSIYFTVRYFVIQLNKKDQFIAKQSRFAAMGEMISMIAHQWRQPLTGMSMTTNNLLLDIELEDIDEDRFTKNLNLINKQIGYLSHTIDDFKNFFKPDCKSEIVDANAVIDESCHVISSTLKNHGIELERDYEDNVKTMTKKNDLMQIILNLVKNAMDAYVENKIQERVIKLSTKKINGSIQIVVQDNAGGIPKDIIEKIFDPYFSTKDKKNGTGLGLYMSKMIVEDHLQGILSVETKDDSTSFTIKIPVKEGM
ncbi:PAS/PAC sensor signal transduction histidine kinase [Sulfurimonas gotlandica GD1]|uniref:histidine kinase n=1 Tax=Sulfurimonas gotlandica (strain DSM 19862 / JCM 16533 / GD1) TaxID=929558 RepID=B6BJ95_SULGG|nr:DUF3365 domain-containing protein [Sulfurimonas gotlandica]EDZ63203.1 histidine kinase [Sulfurimonas gotlandica GD1]EHP30613.1 PAS/PAC sensor signal transduction histidine kinase [Sulfurimonas gotlandica GD1]